MSDDAIPLRGKVLALLKSVGPQSVNDLCINLKISNGSSRSVLVKMHQAGMIERISKGVYRVNGDSRKYDAVTPQKKSA